MASSGLKCFSCLCTCLLVTINNLAILISLIFLALGIVLTFGVNWITNNATIKEQLDKLAGVLKEQNIDVEDLIKNISAMTGTVGIVFIVIGAVLVVISCLGCFGGCCKSRPCLAIYAAIVGAIFLAQITVVIIWYADSNVLKSTAKRAMESSIQNYKGFRSTNVESLLQNILQIFAGCCGVNNGSDFDSIEWEREFTVVQPGWNFTINLTYPLTCCKFNLMTMQPSDLLCPVNNTNSNHQIGCYDEVFKFADKFFLSFFFAGLGGFLLLQLLLIAGALVIFCAEADNSAGGNKVQPAGIRPRPRPRPRSPPRPRPATPEGRIQPVRASPARVQAAPNYGEVIAMGRRSTATTVIIATQSSY